MKESTEKKPMNDQTKQTPKASSCNTGSCGTHTTDKDKSGKGCK